MANRHALLLALGLALPGCYGDVGIPLTIDPAHGSLFGQYEVTITGDLAALGTVDYFSIGGLQVINARWSATAVTATVQGGLEPGPADVVIRGSKGLTNRHGIFTFDAPPPKVPLEWMAFGASYTQGTESNGIDPHTQLFGVSAQVARQAGAYLGLPLFDPQLAPPLQPSDFYPDCTQIPGTGAGLKTLSTLLNDPTTGAFDLRRGRLDWTLQPRNVAVGGAKVADILDGVHSQSDILAHVTNDPTIDASDALGAETTSMIQRVEKLDPDIGFTTDLIGNDLDAAVTEGDDVHPEAITPLAQVQPMLQEMMARLGKLRGQYFIANIPSLTFVPNVAEVRARRIAAGLDTAESFDAKVKQIDDLTNQYNAALIKAMQPYQNLHLVDFKGYVDGVEGGVTVGGELLTPAKWGGLLSLDGLHLSDTGYALYANTFIDTINAALGSDIPRVDVDALHSRDLLAPGRLRALGYTCVPPAM